MEPLIAGILSLAGIIISTFGPSLGRIAEAAILDKDPVALVAAEDVGDILPATTHLDEAMAVAHAHDAAIKLRQHVQDGDTAGMSKRQLAVVNQAVALHDLVLAGTA